VTEPTSASFDRLAQGVYLEGLSVDSQRGAVWYSDVIAGGIHRLSSDGQHKSWNADRQWTGGILLNFDGCVLSSGPGGIAWLNPLTGASGWLLDSVDGKPLDGVNEMTPDGCGGIYFGTVDIPAIARGQAPGPASLYHLQADGTLTLLRDNLTFSNGLMLSADGKRLFHNETFVGTFAYDVRSDGTLGSARQLLDKQDCDGMALDADGNLWITHFRSGEITRLKPDGTALKSIVTPVGAITQVRFGGTDRRGFYFTSVPADAGDGLAEGTVPTKQVSALYRGRSESVGMPVAASNFRLL
jgi:sugar lactone lactonase YvrE